MGLTRMLNKTLVRLEVLEHENENENENEHARRTWLNNPYMESDPFRRSSYCDLEVDSFAWSEQQARDVYIDRGLLEVYQQVGPIELEFEMYGVPEKLIPPIGVNFWLHVLSGVELRSFQVLFAKVEYNKWAGSLYIQAQDRTPPPVPPKPCEKCEKRRQRKWSKRILKAGRKQWGKKFKTIEELNDYEDGYYSEW